MWYEVESNFLVQVLAKFLSRDELKIQPPQNLDWDALLQLAVSHRVVGHLACAIDEATCSRSISQSVRNQLAPLPKALVSHRIRKIHQLKTIASGLALEGVPILLLKGIAQATESSTYPAWRAMHDIDILVPKGMGHQAYQCLKRMGFSPDRWATSPFRWHAEFRFKYSTPFDTHLGRCGMHREDVAVDLHWDPHYYFGSSLLSLNVARFWDRAVARPELGKNVFVADRRDFFQHLLLHWLAESRHERRFLFRIADLASVLARTPNCDELINEICDQYGPDVQSAILDANRCIEALCKGDSATVWAFLQVVPSPPIERPMLVRKHQIFARIPSLREKCLFVLGYFFPSNPSTFADWMSHWRWGFKRLVALVRKAPAQERELCNAFNLSPNAGK